MAESEPISSDKFIAYKYRWVVLTVVFVLNMSNQIIWVAFSPIAFASSTYYDVSLLAINMLSAIFSLMYVPLGFTSSYILDTRGLRIGVLTGIILNTIGGWFRYIACYFGSPHGRYAGTFIGQFLAAAAQPFLLNSSTKLASNWFPAHQRATANMLCTVSPIVGIAIGSVIPPFIVNVPDDMPTLMLVCAIFASVTGIPSIFFMKDRPPTPPSASALSMTFDTFSVGIKKVFKIKAFWFLMVSFGIGVGIFNSLATVFAQIITPFGYTADDAGNYTGVMIGAGLLGAIATAPVIDKWHKYRETYIAIYISAAFAILFLALSIRPNQFGLIMAAVILVGLFSFSILAVSFELAVEATYPVAEGTSAGFLWMFGQILSVILIFSADGFRANESNICWLYVALGFLGAFLSVFIKTDYLRMKAEQEMTANLREEDSLSAPTSTSPSHESISV